MALYLVALIVACQSSPASQLEPSADESSAARPSPRARFEWSVTRLPEPDCGFLVVATTSGLMIVGCPSTTLFSSDHGRSFDAPPWLRSDWWDMLSDGQRLYLLGPEQMLVIDRFGHHEHRLGLPRAELRGGAFRPVALRADPSGLYGLFTNEDADLDDKAQAARGAHPSAGLYRSTDEGRTWVEKTRINAIFTRGWLRELRGSGSQHWLQDRRGRWLSTADEAATWRAFPGGPFADLVIGPPSTLLLRERQPDFGESSVLRRSTDAGRTWQIVPDAPEFRELVAGGNGDWSALTATDSQFFRSRDDGLHWQREAIAPATDPLAAECLSDESVTWTNLWRSADEGYALGWVSPNPSRYRSTYPATESIRLLAHGTPPAVSIAPR